MVKYLFYRHCIMRLLIHMIPKSLSKSMRSYLINIELSACFR